MYTSINPQEVITILIHKTARKTAAFSLFAGNRKSSVCRWDFLDFRIFRKAHPYGLYGKKSAH